jgi:hypothetical protein
MRWGFVGSTPHKQPLPKIVTSYILIFASMISVDAAALARDGNYDLAKSLPEQNQDHKGNSGSPKLDANGNAARPVPNVHSWG